MKQTLKLTGKALLASLLLTGGIAVAEIGVDVEYKNVTLGERLYLYDGYGSKWGLDAGSDGLWFVAERPIGDTYSAAMKIRNDAASNTMVVGGLDDDDNNETLSPTAGFVGIGTDAPERSMDVKWAGTYDERDGLTHVLRLTATNDSTVVGSDAAFALVNGKTNKQWDFRTSWEGNAFMATRNDTVGPELLVVNTTTGTDLTKTMVKFGGVKVFENGHLVTSSSRELKTDIKPLDTQDALDALHKLQPVSYAYKADTSEPVVGFIAEDMPELVAMPSRKSFDSAEVVAVLTSVVKEQERSLAETRAEMEAMRAEFAELKAMKSR